MAIYDIFLRSVPSDADSDDVRLYDPTIADSGGGAVNADFTGSIGEITLVSDVDVIVGAALTGSIGEITLVSDVDVIVGAALTGSVGAITLVSDVDVIVGAALTGSVGEITATSGVSIPIQVNANLTIPALTIVSYCEITTPAPAPQPKPVSPYYWETRVTGSKLIKRRVGFRQ